MKTIALSSSDDRLAARLRIVLAASERLVRTQSVNQRFAWPADSHLDLIVLDWRGRPRNALAGTLLQLERDCESAAPFVVITRPGSTHLIEAIGCRGGNPTDAIVPDVKAVGLLIRAYLNNQPNGAAAALAVALVLEFLPPHATEIINASIGSGFAASSVKECAASLRRDRGTLRRHLRDVGDQVLTPRRVMDIVKAVYAITLLRGTGATIRSVSSAVGFTSKMSLPHLLDRSVGLSPKQARDQAGDRQVEERLHGLLTSCGLGSKARCPHVDSGRSE